MLNKLRSSVSSAANSAVSNAVQIASQVSNYLPGNPVTREYEATQHIASAGPGLVWKVYKGYKKSTKQDAAIFLFEKRQFDKWDKAEREAMFDRLRKGVSQLTRLRHPQVLTVQHPLEESRDTLAFATEPVFASLANVLGQNNNIPSPPPPLLKDFKLNDVEIKYGLMQLSEGLAFLHNSVKIVHRNLCPENVVLNHQGAWKLFGFDFCVLNQAAADQPPFYPFDEYESGRPPPCQPSLDYLAPEYALTHTLDTAADLFPLAVIIHALFSEGRPVFTNHGDFSTFKRNCCELKNTNKLPLPNIPEGVRSEVRLLLHATPQLRPDALQFSKIPYFEDVGVKTLSYLDQMFQWDNMQKSQFYKSLPTIIPQLPHRVCVLRIVPCLMKECINTTMVPFVLPVILLVAERSSKEEFVEHILPHLRQIMKLTEPVQIMLQLMQKMELLLSKTPATDVKSEVLPLLYRALECDVQQIQELCLSVLPSCAHLVESHAMKNALLPRVKKLCVATSYLSVRVNCLVCMGKILEHLDRWLVMDDVFPFLETVPSREAPVIMAIVGTFKVALSHKKLGISKEILATKVLPFLFPLSIENSLTPTQHTSIMSLIKEMTEKVELEHRTKLEQLNSIKDEQKALQMAMPTSLAGGRSNSAAVNGSSSVTAVDAAGDIFAGLDLGQSKAKPGGDRGGGGANKSLNAMTPTQTSQQPTSLSLQDKQRIVKEQNLHETLHKQPPLLPSPPPPSGSITKPMSTNQPASSASQALTSTMISSNMNMMSSSSGGSMQGSAFGNANNVGMSYGGMWPAGANNALLMNGNLSTPSSNFTSWTGANTSNQQQQQQQSRIQQQQTPNMSAFDNLLPSQSQTLSMNQMTQSSPVGAFGNMNTLSSSVGMQGNTSSMMYSGTLGGINTVSPMSSNSSFGSVMTPLRPTTKANTSAQSSVKVLTSSDINDLLS
ncbi:hypothetical protein Pcinc_016896 [Petrolisthes cinctipes]|uniref:Protein kinase domain-containing protein n=1 Tax=Petrolisthes cinctipes TaxID=88211 RepID=A0AAE1FV98_PETCI|nr:hypothetical protein Pcinc_016896 [Petrolisthes cinctipes]